MPAPQFDDSKKYVNGSAADPLPPKTWKLAGSAEDIESFRSLYNLTLVDATPQEAALMPSWPQALFQFLVVSPPFVACCIGLAQIPFFGTKISLAQSLQVVLTPFMFVAWCVSFGFTQTEKATAGWMSVLGWAAWCDLFERPFEYYALPPLVFQWVASFTLVIQRHVGDIGTVAYQVNNLNGCVPVDGVAYLEQGARSHGFRIVQTATFVVSTLFMILLFSVRAPWLLSLLMIMPALAELVMAIVVGSKGTPMVVSGNCMLVELGPGDGFLDTGINTRWKVFASFMGF
ncbi:unnamed protein product [Clonostachys rosea]|uniref:Uncharacterized protein n=1 Tax=Bionectria ochroleuca TaxID=29856 RepID=A0ABY6UGI7_BIOOC|nr:unnamed protein product [Clonostachys rosea]